MTVLLRHIWLVAALLLTAAQSAFADWDYYTGTNADGGVRVTAQAEENGFLISLQCDAGDDPDVFHLTFVSDYFPHLDNTDSAETQLIFKFDGTGKDFVADGWSDVWYFAPDLAWTGSLYFEAGVLDSFGGAATMRVINMNSEEVTRFSMKGSRKAEQAIRAMCHQGLTIDQWAAMQAPSGQQQPAPQIPNIAASADTGIPDFDTVELLAGDQGDLSPAVSVDDVYDALLAGDAAKVRDYVLAGFDANNPPDYEPGENNTPFMYFMGYEMVDNPQMQSGLLQLIQGGAKTRVDWSGAPSPVVFAVRKENARAAYALIHLGYPIDYVFTNGRTLMAEAARLGMADVVQAILDQGIDPDYAEQDESPALLYAATHGHIDIVEALIEARANVNATTHQGATALHLAARAGHEQIVRMLVEAGADTDVIIGSATAAQIARNNGQTAIANYLDGLRGIGTELTVKASAMPLAIPNTSTTFSLVMEGGWQRPLNFAVTAEPSGLISFEQAFNDTRVYDSGEPGDTNLFIDSRLQTGTAQGAVQLQIIVSDATGQQAATEQTIYVGQSAGYFRGRLVDAAKALDTRAIRETIAEIRRMDDVLGNDPTWMSESMRYGCVRGFHPNCEAYLNGFLAYHIAATDDGALLDWTLEWGADPNYVSSRGEPILFNTARAGKWDNVARLLAAGANPNAMGDDGGSVLLYAVGDGQRDIVHQLLALGADPNRGSVTKGMTPLHHAAVNNDRQIIDMLRSAGAVNVPDADGRLPGWFSYWAHRDLQLALALGYDEAQAYEDRANEPEFDWNEFMVGLNQRLVDQQATETGAYSGWESGQEESEEFVLDVWAMPEVVTLGSDDIETWGSPELDTIGGSDLGQCNGRLTNVTVDISPTDWIQGSAAYEPCTEHWSQQVNYDQPINVCGHTLYFAAHYPDSGAGSGAEFNQVRNAVRILADRRIVFVSEVGETIDCRG